MSSWLKSSPTENVLSIKLNLDSQYSNFLCSVSGGEFAPIIRNYCIPCLLLLTHIII